MNRLLLFGGRNFNDPIKMDHELISFIETYGPIGCVIHGAAKGADDWADYFAKQVLRVPVFSIAAKWDDVTAKGAVIKYTRGPSGKAYNALAGHWRNQELIDRGKPTHAMGFEGGTGTADMAKRLLEAKIPIINAGYKR